MVPVSDSETLYHTLVRVLHPLLGTEFDANVSYFVGFSGFYLADCSLPLDLRNRKLVLWVRVHLAIHGDLSFLRWQESQDCFSLGTIMEEDND